MDENEQVDVLSWLGGHGGIFSRWLDDELSIEREDMAWKRVITHTVADTQHVPKSPATHPRHREHYSTHPLTNGTVNSDKYNRLRYVIQATIPRWLVKT